MFLTFLEYAASRQKTHIFSNNPELVLKKQRCTYVFEKGVLLMSKTILISIGGISESSLFVSCFRIALIQVNIHLLSCAKSFS